MQQSSSILFRSDRIYPRLAVGSFSFTKQIYALQLSGSNFLGHQLRHLLTDHEIPSCTCCP